MPKVTYVQQDGTETVLDLPPGTTVMRGAVAAGVRGIVAECGGNLMCATCHVYAADAGLFPDATADEDELLDCTAEPRRDNSRLSCQLTLTEQIGDLVIHVPGAQT
ncbi:2Fe-2S iron-sulfur cluster binding domain-containing protein [Streptomyces ipomoeae]|jgi:2Fe-2S ferredoxin|uniref:2Fe-2S iron-sulfur cluster binding domain-containing protein n=1 Tax=Streptomyces ipomoeae TaxID=103232 RepID=A0AAE9B3G7_9ACTN|nr:2Fe-2S iron-sulfur cluster-binding protein [Streptomyces ipomoeae]MDX2880845.1 2Fe-2S iron-sulfur cluster-binding protein [Streptomyces ipomoeae]TQE36088.1 2Fe-2S iron-sulfur cluster binding domain-containing protein [Streptomyces ipomoeae]TQE39296.1 2Fe-2S iron-sulfur cluster binding domain-containing protein [Streptomyces ipomoeae]